MTSQMNKIFAVVIIATSLVAAYEDPSTAQASQSTKHYYSISNPHNNDPITPDTRLCTQLWSGNVTIHKGGDLPIKVTVFAYEDITTSWSGLTGFLKVQRPVTASDDNMIVVNLHNAKFFLEPSMDYQVRIETTFIDQSRTERDGTSRLLTLRMKDIPKQDLDDLLAALTLSGAQQINVNEGTISNQPTHG